MDKIVNFESAKLNIERKNNIDEISLLRTVLMYCVLAIHILNIPVSKIQTGTYWQSFFYVLREMLVFAVPGFIFVSVVIISHKERNKPLKEFYKNKFLRVFVPYILWSIFYQLILFLLGARSIENFSDTEYIKNIFFFGKGYEHLYFMPILIEFIIISPLLIFFAKKIKDKPIFAISISLLTQMIVYFLNKNVLSLPMLKTTFLWYFSVGFLGIWFGLEYKKNITYIRNKADKIMILLLLSGCIMQSYELQLWHSLWESVSFDTFPYTLNMHIYFILAVFTLLIISKNIIEKRSEKSKKTNYMLWISKYSYGIYFMHPVFTFLLMRFMQNIHFSLFMIFVITTTLILAHICAKITEFFEKVPIIRLAFGKNMFLKY